MLTKNSYKILKAIEPGSYASGINAKAVAWSLWGDDPKREYLFLASSNQGNGACRGKKAWLCAGSQVGKLRKKGLVDYDRNFTGYYLTRYGREAVREYESSNQKSI